MSESLFDQDVLETKEIKYNIVEKHFDYGSFVWKILFETVGLNTQYFDKDDFYNDIDYKLLYQYSFVEYLASYSLRINHNQQSEELIIPNFSGVVVEKVERDKKNVEISSSCAGSCESLYESVLKQSSVEMKYVNDVINKDIQSQKIDSDRLRLIYRYPLEINSKILHQIHIDIKRLSQESKSVGDVDVSYMYYNILVLISHRRPSLGYIQGMADILVPFIVEFSRENITTAESSAYFCYSKLLDSIQDNITTLQGELLFLLSCRLEMIDPDMYSYLKRNKLEIHMFAFRWFNCLFIREFPYELYKRVFTTMLCYESLNDFLVYFGVSLILHFKSQLMIHDFGANIIILQNISTYEWSEKIVRDLLHTTSIYYKTFGVKI